MRTAGAGSRAAKPSVAQGRRWLAPVGGLLLSSLASFDALGATPSDSLHLTYQAFIAGAKAGTARIHVERSDSAYAVRGDIVTQGLWHRLAPWRARFAVAGRVEDGRGRPTELGMQEWARRKERTIHVAHGTLRQLRNGRLRPQRPAPPGVDLMSALWAGGQCEAEQVLNNGRHYYAMTRHRHEVRPDGSERCDYHIVDDDGEAFQGWVSLGERQGRRVPLEIGIVDGVTRRLALVSATPSAGGEDEPRWNAASAARAVTPAVP